LAKRVSVDGGQHLLDWVLPPHCLLCGAPGAGGRDLCAPCARDLPRNPVCCPRCALPLATPAPLCGRCLKRAPAYAAAWVPFRYAFPLDRLVSRFKFSADLAAGRLLGQLLADTAGAIDECFDLLVPLPLARARLRERGYNQALELARPVARRLGVALDAGALRRERATAPQTGLDRKSRRLNVAGAFRAGVEVRGRRVALLDDVVTTGATVQAAARALKQAGARQVIVLALARAPMVR
jgi:ComF family protein